MVQIPDAHYDMRYAGERNILGAALPGAGQPLIDEQLASALRSVVADLHEQGLSLVIWDAYRSAETQAALRAINDDTRYVLEASNHELGLAIDVTLCDQNDMQLDMGTDHDDFTDRAHVGYRNLTREQQANRLILSGVMEKHGFAQWPYEWWHFDFLG